MCVAGAIALLLAACLYLVESCPSSCAVCSREATVCQGLAYITAVPANTEVLMITDGNIRILGINNFSFLSNLTLLRLSGNKIQEIQAGAFLNLTQLRSLVLDGNRLSAASVSSKTFLPLRNLRTLQLNNNFFASISGTWFESTKRLLKLEINRNQIANLTRHSLGTNAFRSLEHLELSSNFISFIHEETFLSLWHLRELDLSKNRLTKLPDVFSSLSHLSLLNLGQNLWNCTCELQELADYLRNYTYSAVRILRNRNGLRCSYTSNPLVRSLLQLTQWNCAPRSYNILAASKEGDRGYFREAIIITILILAGVIAALFLIIIIIAVKCNLRPRDSTEQDSTSCCCGGARDFPGIRSHVPKIHVSQAGNGNVVPFVDPARICNPYMKKSTGSVHLGYNPEGSGKSFRATSKENVPGSYYVCFHCRLVQWRPTCPPVMSDADGAACISSNVQGIPYGAKHFVRAAPWDGASTAFLRYDQGATSIRGPVPPPSVLPGVKSDDTHKQDPVYGVPERGQRKAVSYQQSADVLSRSTTKGSVQMKIHAARPPPHTHPSQKRGPRVLLDERRDISLPADNDLICKYMECDKLGEPRRQITETETQNVKFQEQKIQTRVTQGNCFLNNDSVLLSASLRQVNIPRRSVGFYIPHTRREPGMAANTSQSRQEQQFFRPHLGSKYLLTINKDEYEGSQRSHAETPVDPLEDLDMDDQVSSLKYSRKSHDYLRVKVNLKPFQKLRVHPQQITGVSSEPTKRGHGSKQLPRQLPRKKSKVRSVSSDAANHSNAEHAKLNGVEDSTRAPVGMGDCTVTKNKPGLDEKSKEGAGGRVASSDSHANDTVAIATLTERVSSGAGLPTKSVVDCSPNISAGQLSKVLNIEKPLGAEVDGKENVSTDESVECSQSSCQASQGLREGLTDIKLQTQHGTLDKSDTPPADVLGTKLSNVTGISGGAATPSRGNYTECETDIAGSSLPGNKVNDHLEGNERDVITEVGHALGPNNSIKTIAVNEPVDRATEVTGCGSRADPGEGKSQLDGGCAIEKMDFEGNETTDINDPDHVKTYAATNLQDIPRRAGSPSSTAPDTPAGTNEHMQADNGLLTQGSQDNKQDKINTSRQQINDSRFKRSDPTSGQLDASHSNEALLSTTAPHSAPKPTEVAEGAEQAHALRPQHAEQSNSNNNHSRTPAGTARRHLSLSDTSKVIILVESLNKTVDIQRYLTERGTRLQAQQNPNPSGDGADSTSGDRSQRKKISLILPEKSGGGAPKSTSKKIK